jgi:hypothetical protein
MDDFIGARLRRVTRLSWAAPGAAAVLASGPTHMAFDGDRSMLITCRSDWALEWNGTAPGEGWLQPFAYEAGGGRWVARDASTEKPFGDAIGRALTGWAPEFNELGEPVGVALDFEDMPVALRSWEGEVQAVIRT